MGWAKYYEDNVRISEERMYMSNSFSTPVVATPRYNCPYCFCGFSSYSSMVEHIVREHSNQYAFFIVNGAILKSQELEIARIQEIKAINYGSAQVNISVVINEDTLLVKSDLNSHSNVLDVTRFIAGHIAKSVTLIIETPTEQKKYTITQSLDIHSVNDRMLNNGLYKSRYFFDEVSHGRFKIPEYRILLSILAAENDFDTAEMLVEKVNSEADYSGIDSEIISDFYLYYSLMAGESSDSIINAVLPNKYPRAYRMLHALLNYDFEVAEKERIAIGRCNSNFELGVCLLMAYLRGNDTDVLYYEKQYTGGGILRDIIAVVHHIMNGSIDDFETLVKDVIPQFRHFYHYPLICDIINVYSAVKSEALLSIDTYTRFNTISPLVCAIKIMQTENEELRQKYLKSAIKRFSNVEWFFIFGSAYVDAEWSANRITKKIPEIYWKYVSKQNDSLIHPLSSQLLLEARNKPDIEILPLGNAVGAGCSCFALSCNGFNILLDAGIYPSGKGEEAYPNFDLFSKPIDAIVISHAHLDHSGAVIRAHSIWPDAPIITTSATKALLEPFLHDIAVQGEIDDETEVKFLEKTLAIDTYNSLLTVDFNAWVPIAHNLKIKLHPAGHLLGAAIVEIHAGDSRIVYTGDFSTHSQELTSGVKILNITKAPDLLICETTYYHTDREYDWQEQRTKICDAILDNHIKGKTVLLPSNALGRSQELLCIISDLMTTGKISESTPVFIGGFACKLCAAVAPVLNDKYQQMLDKAIPITDDIVPTANSIIICSSASMRKNTTSYKVAEKIKKRNPKELAILTSGGFDDDTIRKEFVRPTDFYPLSVHSSREETDQLIDTLMPKSIIFVHSGTDDTTAHQRMVMNTLETHGGNILPMILSNNVRTNVWDIKAWIEKENKYE